MRASAWIWIWVFPLIACADRNTGLSSTGTEVPRRPALVVGIVVDQMKWDLLERYRDDFGAGGFRRLMESGFAAHNLHYNYVPTYTGPGHASVFTGTTPAYHGIVANDWYVRDSGTEQYCARDTSVRCVGSGSPAGQMSPVHLLSTTLGDELRIFSGFRSRVVGVAMKDRGAILPAGRLANAAYWYAGGAEDAWISSSWYRMDSLPDWVRKFNGAGYGGIHLERGWSLMLPDSAYGESDPDLSPFEQPFRGQARPVFPYDLEAIARFNNQFDLIKATPWGNTLTIQFAMEAIRGEQLGADEVTDMLCMSLSSTDYVGHQFGVHSRELQDTYIRLDRDLESFLLFLDKNVGRGDYLVFLTADHGAAPNPGWLGRMGGAASYFRSDALQDALEAELNRRLGGAEWILAESNQSIYLDRELILERGFDLCAVQRMVASFVSNWPGVARAISACEIPLIPDGDAIGSGMRRGYRMDLGGDVLYALEPGWMEYGPTGTTHGSGYRYDTHVPALFYGAGVEKGETWAPHTICDIAPTIAALCRIPLPNACTGSPISGIVK